MSAVYTTNYIFINPKNARESIIENKTFLSIKKYHDRWYSKFNQHKVKYWSYNDIAELLSGYDADLRDLYLRVNPYYASLLSDIGRFIILYKYGGIYHDLKFLPKNRFYKKLDLLKNDFAIIGEQHPKQPHRIRSGNIISYYPGDIFFASILDSIKSELSIAKKNQEKGSVRMFAIGSGIYIDHFDKIKEIRNDLRKVKLTWTLLKYSKKIYKSNITKWQNIDEIIVF